MENDPPSEKANASLEEKKPEKMTFLVFIAHILFSMLLWGILLAILSIIVQLIIWGIQAIQ